MLKHGILGLLNYGEMSGYEIMTAFRDSLQFFWTANTSQIYRELQNLKARGLVRDHRVEQKGKPDKNVFAITPKGKEELKAWLQDENYGTQNFGLLMKVFFAGELSPRENIQRFLHLQEACRQYATGLKAAEKSVEAYSFAVQEDPRKAAYWKMTISFGKKYTKMLEEWCQECREQLEAFADENTGD